MSQFFASIVCLYREGWNLCRERIKRTKKIISNRLLLNLILFCVKDFKVEYAEALGNGKNQKRICFEF